MSYRYSLSMEPGTVQAEYKETFDGPREGLLNSYLAFSWIMEESKPHRRWVALFHRCVLPNATKILHDAHKGLFQLYLVFAWNLAPSSHHTTHCNEIFDGHMCNVHGSF